MKKQSVATLVLVALSIAIVLTSDEVLVMDEAIWNEVRGAEAFEDLWGHRVEWTREEDGWDERKKRDLLAIHVQNEMQPTLVPAFTELGFKKMSIPEELYRFILDHRRPFDLKPERCPPSAHQNCDRIVVEKKKRRKEPSGNTAVMGVLEPKVFRDTLNEVLRPILEEWSGVALEPTEMYGIRRYKDGAWLQLHVDKLRTHVVSAILQIDQEVDEVWPLMLIDLTGNSREVDLQPGEMLLYESAKVPHGRQRPLRGAYYDNLFVHFRPQKGWYENEFDAMEMPDVIISKGDLL